MTGQGEGAADSIKGLAAELGFDGCGIARADAPDPEDRLGSWLRSGYHGDMEWLPRTQAIRQDPGLKLPSVRSVVVVTRNYLAARPPQPAGSGKVSRYAWGRDYHRVLIKPLRRLASRISELVPGAACYASVDSGPVLERAWAKKAGLGWIGKNSLVLNKQLGSWFFLGTVLTTAALREDAPVPGHCGTCTACLEACPTGAIVTPGVVDSRRCISYQTIENRGAAPEGLPEKFGDWVLGCDVCQEVCPWNRRVCATGERDFFPREAHVDLLALAAMTEDAFRDRFAGTPVLRAKHAGMVRNARVALNNAAGGHGRTEMDEG